MTGQWPKIGAALVGLVDERLDGAACKGMAPWFDVDPDVDEEEDDTAYRIAAAARVCARCPVTAACEVAVAEQTRPVGVWAGKPHGGAARGRGRPRKDGAA
ncbi:WhiB family transcriptional regulator [Nocardia sp. NPDC058705]|uniref:WhiB family transcriptional regulator n=1 Tax=Nocardia sp. NPDC058705 TaxID=3346609 RepID=UPI0036BB55C3